MGDDGNAGCLHVLVLHGGSKRLRKSLALVQLTDALREREKGRVEGSYHHGLVFLNEDSCNNRGAEESRVLF